MMGDHRAQQQQGWRTATVTPGTERSGTVMGASFKDSLIHQNIAPPVGQNYAAQRIFLIAYQKRCGRLRHGEVGYRSKSGWKIHVAADVLQADDVAARVLPVLCGLTVWHKYVPNKHELFCMAGTQAYKFITIYPNPDNVDAPDGWRNVVGVVAGALAAYGSRPRAISDPRERKQNPDGATLPDFISMRQVADFNNP